MEAHSRHQCLIYDGPPSAHLDLIAAIVVENLAANYRCFYLNSPAMVAGLRARLAAAGVAVAEMVARGSLVLTSDQSHLLDGEFHSDRMLARLSGAVQQALADGYGGLWASGDMLWEFGSERNLPKLLLYETGVDALIEAQPALRGICLYHRDILPSEALRAAVFAHRTVLVNGKPARTNPHHRNEAVVRARAAAAGDPVSEFLNAVENG